MRRMRSSALIIGQPQAGARPVTHMNDALLSQIDMQPLESLRSKARTTKRSGFHGQAAGIRSEQKISAEIFDPRRAARGVGK